MITQAKLDRLVEDIKAMELDINPVQHYSTDFTRGHTLTVYDANRGEDVAIGTIKDFWLPELFSSAPELALEVKRLRGLLDAIHWDAFAEDDTTLEIDREVAERIRRGD